MRTITLNVPQTESMQAFDYSVYLAAKLYGDGLLTSGQAASVAGLSKRTFIELMGKYGVSIFSSNIDDLNSDIANA